MLHSIKDSKGNVICLCGDKFYEDIMNITKEKLDEFLYKKYEQNIQTSRYLRLS